MLSSVVAMMFAVTGINAQEVTKPAEKQTVATEKKPAATKKAHAKKTHAKKTHAKKNHMEKKHTKKAAQKKMK